MENQNLISNELRIDEFAQIQLTETAKWAKFLAILGFIGSVLIVLIAFAIPSMLGGPSNLAIETTEFGFVFTIIYLIAGALYFFISLYLYRFAVGILRALASTSQDELNIAFKNHKMVYKSVGIITIVYLGIMFLLFILGFIGALMN